MRTPSLSSDRPGTALAPLSRQAGRIEPAAYAVLRSVFGIVMMTHGLPKVLGIGHGSMTNPLAGATRLIADVLHLPFAPQLAYAVGLFETIGGLLLVMGLLTRPVAALMAVQMVVICYIHRAHFAWIDRGMEYPLVLLFVATMIAARGGDHWSLDRRLRTGA
jgi:putative oxidoreductase